MAIRYDITNDIIIDLYFNKNFNRRQTAEKLKCSVDLITYRLKQMGLNPKSMSECVSNGKRRHINITDDMLNRLNGELLGDGGLNRYKDQADFRESFGYNKKEWALYLISLFKNHNIPIMGKELYFKTPSGKSKNPSWTFSTLNTFEFAKLHKQWYIKNDKYDDKMKFSFNNRKYIKVIPKNLKLTPLCFLHWYIGDGALDRGCVLHTEGFKRNEVEFLRYLLKRDMDVKTSYYKKGVIYVPQAELYKILEIIGNCPVECYKYKWDVKYSNKNRISGKINMEMVEKFIGGS